MMCNITHMFLRDFLNFLGFFFFSEFNVYYFHLFIIIYKFNLGLQRVWIAVGNEAFVCNIFV
jgi:hypothetical protein